MALLRNSNLKENGMYLYIIKITVFTFLIWAYILYNNLYNSSSYLTKEYNDGNTSDIQFHRSLAKHMPKKNLYNTKLKENLSDVRGGHKTKYLAEDVSSYPQSHKSVFKNLEDDISAYSKLKRRGLNNLDLYKKVYKHRYDKKSFFAKMDCYCEKKIFDKFEKVNQLAENYQNNKKCFRKIFFKKYGIGLIFFSLLPFFGLILPIMFSENFPIKFDSTGNPRSSGLNNTETIISKEAWEIIKPLNTGFLFFLIIIVLIVIIYLFVKTIKYEKLKRGKDKMSINEYFCLCKELFLLY